ncbi:MAG: hypothetical protein A3E07_02510 [Candidatus Wildermuthbacteria bacterium RIFCSPHIGHO2_12_FULL_45_9]|uniref:Uncharacterized protein n=1 Tax=Candidatus Wildermuthbacteria bacterium RIFCSPHIGHO2_02_FULL_45_25 TaxID=1802450 RepID=A0A1G2R0T2_9BACT|nr:MAG: hypothetical protein A2748_01015 [Candidatus Wildermuthbacteria bacterium RIFCSPHIGHO2_01_FULL_45_20]OHA66456.1 MAG: hypothetical protein A3C04_01390 [Candidatus Wildermuthbacteria bacterium RIFCSPHIGHO2_02_FULL_45_25]OHA71490.1 MAG: hypothetical protein A3E07_02510 [Candidatus Wildermuthbacteria bacterium RIFCSPHIGHO2_12_FULL_45_9]
MLSNLVEFVKKHETAIILAMGVALISLLSFGIGYLTARERFKEQIRIEYEQPNQAEKHP